MDRVEVLRDWLVRIGLREWVWFAKRLSANDTGLTGGHQAGFYLPRGLALDVAPELGAKALNLRRAIRFRLVSHGQDSKPSLVYYNNRFYTQSGTRDEFRVTGFGGRGSALQDPVSTGAILVTAWDPTESVVEAWLADALDEEEAMESVVGPIEPGTLLLGLRGPDGSRRLELLVRDACDPAISDLPSKWAVEFPSGRDLTDEAIRRSRRDLDPDRRLVARYRCEFGLFKVVEAAHVVPMVERGFGRVDDFLAVAQTVANRRKSRAGRSLELHLARIFEEEGVEHETGQTTEGGRRPDFVFPSIADYRAGRATRMLGVKTSVKDRWRQVLDEAARIPQKHLFTLAEGVSLEQFSQMEEAGLQLVVPASNRVKFPSAIRPKLMTLADFVTAAR